MKTQKSPWIRPFVLSCSIIALGSLSPSKLLADQVAQADQSVSSDSDDLAPQPKPSRTPRRRKKPAQEPTEQQESSNDPTSKPFSIALMGGLTLGAASSYTVTTPSATQTNTDTTTSGAFFGAEASYSLMSYFAAGLEIERSMYNYQNTVLSSDSELSFLVAPRLQYAYQEFLFWGGVSLGLTLTSIGTTTGSGPIIVGTSSSTAGFTIEPRAGVDYKLTDQFFVGALFSYLNTRGSVSTPSTSTVVNNTTVLTQTTESFTRSWVELGVRVGMSF